MMGLIIQFLFVSTASSSSSVMSSALGWGKPTD